MYGSIPSKFSGNEKENELYKGTSKCGWFLCKMIKWCSILTIGCILSIIIFFAVISYIDNKSEVAPIAAQWNNDISGAIKSREFYDNEYVSNNFKIYVIVSESRKEYIENVIENSLDWNSNNGVSYIDAISKDGFEKDALIEAGIISDKITKFLPGRVACVLSHKKALETFLNDDEAEYGLILEDDIQENPLLEYSADIYVNAIMNEIPNDWNFINFGRCWDWCYSDSYISDTNMFVVESLNPLCTHMYAVTKNGAKTIINNLLPLQLLNIDQLIARMIRDTQLTGYASSIPVLLQNKKKTGSLAAPNIKHPYRMCATWYQEILSQIFDTKFLSSDGLLNSDGLQILQSDGILSSDGKNILEKYWFIKLLSYFGIVNSDGINILESDGLLSSDHVGILESDSILSSDGVSILESDGILSSDGIRILSNNWFIRLLKYFGVLSSDGLLSSDGVNMLESDGILSSDKGGLLNILESDGILSSDGIIRSFWIFKYIFGENKNDEGDLYY